MFSLGNKEAIVNSSAKYPVSFATIDSAEDKIIIQGFGSFKEDQLVSAVCQRYQASRVEVMTITAPTATELGITSGTNVPVTFSIVINTFRDSAEWTNDFIKNGRPIVIEILVTAGETSAQVGAKMVSAFDEWISKFSYADIGLPFTYANVSGAVTLTMKDYTLIFRNRVEFKVNQEVTPIAVATTKYQDTTLNTGTGATSATIPMASTAGLRVGDTVAIGTTLADADTESGLVIQSITVDTNIVVDQSITFATADNVFLNTTALDPTFSGKYLEENARMSLSTTSDSYGISPDEKPQIAGNYATVTFVVNDANVGGIDGQYAKHAFLGTTRGEKGGTREFKFTLYFLEGSDMWTASAGNKVFDVVDWLDDSPITPSLLLADGSVAADAATWVA
jgi:hypothetical protein